MSNNAYLFNLPEKNNDFLNEKNRPKEYIYLGTGSNKIHIPWFFCFDESDLMPVNYTYESSSWEETTIKIMTPCTTVEKARNNLVNSLNLMQKNCEDDTLGKEYWEKSVSLFNDFPYEFITLYPVEVLFLEKLEISINEFNKCFSRCYKSFEYIKKFASYNNETLPYSVVELYTNPSLPDPRKTANSVAMDINFANVEHRTWIKPKQETATSLNTTTHPWWQFWKA